MEEKNYLQQLQEIQTLMNRSTRFLSLSGLSGILAGTYALCGAIFVYVSRNEFFHRMEFGSNAFLKLLFIACSVLFLSVFTGIFLSRRKAKRKGEKIWTASSKQFLINTSIPLITGGIVGFLLVVQRHFELISPMTLLFYGLALVNGSKYTFETIRSLGLIFVLLGLLNLAYPFYGLYFWTLGFGFSHIIYGAYMYIKFDRNN